VPRRFREDADHSEEPGIIRKTRLAFILKASKAWMKREGNSPAALRVDDHEFFFQE